MCEGNVTLPETVRDVGGMFIYSFLYHKGNGLTAASTHAKIKSVCPVSLVVIHD